MLRVPPTRPRCPVHSTPRRHLPRGGFTLVELMVTVAMVGVALGLAVPRLARMANQSRVQRAAQTLQSEVQQAFAIAGRNRVPVRLRWNSASLQLQVTNLAGNNVFRRMSVGSGVFGLASSDIAMTPQTLTVFPNGLANDSLVIAVTKGGYSRTVRISRSGMVRSRER